MTTSVFNSTFSCLVDEAAKYYKYSCTFSKMFHLASIFKVLVISVVSPGGVKNGKFVTLTPFQKNRPKSMKPP